MANPGRKAEGPTRGFQKGWRRVWLVEKGLSGMRGQIFTKHRHAGGLRGAWLSKAGRGVARRALRGHSLCSFAAALHSGAAEASSHGTRSLHDEPAPAWPAAGLRSPALQHPTAARLRPGPPLPPGLATRAASAHASAPLPACAPRSHPRSCKCSFLLLNHRAGGLHLAISCAHLTTQLRCPTFPVHPEQAEPVPALWHVRHP